MSIELHRLATCDDTDWPVWKRIYIDCFPESERMSEGYFLRVFEEADPAKHALTIRRDGAPVGMAYYEEETEAHAAYLWYLAIDSEHQGQGLGSKVYEELARQFASRFDLLIFEVEIP